MRVLVACELSGIIRDAFRDRGHDAWSCDLLPSDADNRFHIQRDARLVLNDGWDLMIAHPPCNHLCSSGARWFKEKRADGRQQVAVKFFMVFTEADISKVVIENPVGIMSTQYRKPDQIIQPYEYGHPESKRTCLWLKGLPLLEPTKIMEPEYYTLPDGTEYRDKKSKGYSKTHYCPEKLAPQWANRTLSGQNKLGPSALRSKIRSMTYPGIAAAMAEQWGSQN